MNRSKVWAQEIAEGVLIVLILSNIISYVRQPELSFTTFPSEKMNLLNGTSYSYNGTKPLLVHFWATWCPTCKLEASNIQSISEEYEVVTFAVNSGLDEQLKSYMDEEGYDFRVVNDQDGFWAKKFNVEAFPTTFIYDSKGELKFTEVGYSSTVGLLGRMKLSE